jgi:hypothetical protein
MPQLSALIVASLTAVLVAAGLAPAANSPAAPQEAQKSFPKPTNLKTLPKNTSGEEVDKLMRSYNGDLGVECSFCHAQDPTTHKDDYPSDANPEKDQARYMIYMTADLNEKYLEEMPDRRYADPITCGTCHRGKDHPSVFAPAQK